MVKWRAALAVAVVAAAGILPVAAFAAVVITPGVQTNGGTVTHLSWYEDGNGANVKLTVNGTTEFLWNYAGAGQQEIDVSVPFSAGDNVQLVSANGPPIYAPVITGDFAAPPPPPPPSLAINVPTSFTPALTADVSAQMGDKGTLQLLGIAGGVYLLFYVMRQIIALPPKKKGD